MKQKKMKAEAATTQDAVSSMMQALLMSGLMLPNC